MYGYTTPINTAHVPIWRILQIFRLEFHQFLVLLFVSFFKHICHSRMLHLVPFFVSAFHLLWRLLFHWGLWNFTMVSCRLCHFSRILLFLRYKVSTAQYSNQSPIHEESTKYCRLYLPSLTNLFRWILSLWLDPFFLLGRFTCSNVFDQIFVSIRNTFQWIQFVTIAQTPRVTIAQTPRVTIAQTLRVTIAQTPRVTIAQTQWHNRPETQWHNSPDTQWHNRQDTH